MKCVAMQRADVILTPGLATWRTWRTRVCRVNLALNQTLILKPVISFQHLSAIRPHNKTDIEWEGGQSFTTERK